MSTPPTKRLCNPCPAGVFIHQEYTVYMSGSLHLTTCHMIQLSYPASHWCDGSLDMASNGTKFLASHCLMVFNVFNVYRRTIVLLRNLVYKNQANDYFVEA